MPRIRRGHQADFDEYVTRGDGCWIWTGRTDPDGYGKYRLHGKEIRAHRFALERKLGRKLHDGMMACHKCDNPPCVNPDCLFEGTALDNTRDMIAKGRRAANTPPLSKPTKVFPETKEQIMRLRESGMTQKEIAALIGISQGYVSKVLRREPGR